MLLSFPRYAPCVFACITLTCLSAVEAGGLEQLKAFIEDTHSMQASFEQTVTQQSGRKQQSASGTVSLLRPGKFNWRYQKPYEQLVVGDGQKLWIYDPDLKQVTVKSLGAALGSSPAAILAGSNDMEKNYKLTEQPGKDGVEWVLASPKSRDSSFEQVRMGFSDRQLVTMELKDNFGQQTTIHFSKMDKNPKLAADLFNFTPPKGAEVVSADQ